MMTEMDDPMVLESVLAARAREKKQALLENGVFENSVGDSPASDALEVANQVVGMEISSPAPTHSQVGDDIDKPGDGAQSESAQPGEDLALPMMPSEGGRVIELPFESSSFPSSNSGAFNDVAGEGTAATQKKRRKRGKKWIKNDTEDLLGAVSKTNKASSRMEQGTDSDPYWDAIAKAVPGRTGLECRGRMDTLKRSFSTTKHYCDDHGKEFKQLNEVDFGEMKVSPQLTEAWYNQIRDHCPPRPKKKSKTNGAGSSTKSTGFLPGTSTLGLPACVFSDGIDQGEPASVDPPAGQLDHQVVDLLHQAPPASPPWSDLEDLPAASSPELPVVDSFQQQAPAPPSCSEHIDYFLAIPIEPAVSAPSPRFDFLEDLGEAWPLDSNKF